MHCQTQWRSSGFGMIGLDYNAVFRVADALGIEMSEGLLNKMQAMEFDCLEEWAKKR